MAKYGTRFTTRVSDLRKILSELPDDTVLVVPSSDHSYRECGAMGGTAIYNADARVWSEDHGQELEDGDKRIGVLIIGG